MWPKARAPAPAEQHARIELLGQEVSYLLRRSSRRTLGLTIDGRGLVVSLPLRVSHAEAERFMRERAQWIIDKLALRAAQPQPQALAVQDGLQLWVQGQPCEVRISPGTSRGQWLKGEASLALHLHVRAGSDPRRVLLRELQQHALSYFAGRVAEYAYLLGEYLGEAIILPPVRLTNARTRWGSCSRLSGVRLNWRLIHLPHALIDYVVAHEMAHLVEMNHSPRFWAVVGELYPDYTSARAALRDAAKFIPAW